MIDNLNKQYEQESGCSGCKAGGYNRRIGCSEMGCNEKCRAVVGQITAGTRLGNLKMEAGLFKCNQSCRQGVCELSGGCRRNEIKVVIES